MVDYTTDQGELDFRGRWRFCFIPVFHVCDMLLSPYFRHLCLALDGFRLFASGCICFEGVVGGFRRF